ncbi:hypothetical protein [Streptomyces marianii]|uniref:Uncharacterized protein n=1 Tax=Streptomyces marianii TaxID=1817406 RepID=A0A5R9DVW6_9ACTN|nr:hypothetical protein [Streptomyces marianii]TLQ39273.1 hypothetical protein FEF34_38420 [Streptomyces marianii]
MHIQHRIPPGRPQGAARRPRPAPLSPPPEWRHRHLFVEPRYTGITGDDDLDDAGITAPPEPPAFRSRRRPPA